MAELAMLLKDETWELLKTNDPKPEWKGKLRVSMLSETHLHKLQPDEIHRVFVAFFKKEIASVCILYC